MTDPIRLLNPLIVLEPADIGGTPADMPVGGVAVGDAGLAATAESAGTDDLGVSNAPAALGGALPAIDSGARRPDGAASGSAAGAAAAGGPAPSAPSNGLASSSATISVGDIVAADGAASAIAAPTSSPSAVATGASVHPGSRGAVSFKINTFDIIPVGDSAETAQNSEPSLAVNPLNANQIIAGAFGASNSANPYFLTLNGGTTWADYGTLAHDDKSLAWLADGSAMLTAVLTTGFDVSTFSGTTGGSFALLNTYTSNNTHDLDQPWIRTGPSNHVYVAYNDLHFFNNSGGGKTAFVNVSTNGGTTFTPVSIDSVGGGATGGQDSPAVRLAVNGGTVYAVFARWDSLLDTDTSGDERLNSHVVVVRSDNGGADSFTALNGATGTAVAAPTSVFANTRNGSLTLGQERIAGGDLALAVDPNNAAHVVVAFLNAPGPTNAGLVLLAVAESTDSGATWNVKFTTSPGTRSAQPALAISSDGVIGLLYNNYNPVTDALSQHLVTTSDDFLTTTDTVLATEKNSTPVAAFNPYLGDFFDLQAVGTTFYGIFSASNADDGTNATIPNVTFQRHFTGTAGTATFQLKDNSNNNVANSIDPYVFVATEVPCFHRGTRILTEKGEVPVEELAVGDRVVTLSGMTRPIVWIGIARSLVNRANRAVWPIVVKHGALSEGVPQRDLYLTHGHSLYLGGVLIPVERLVNHCSILWDETPREVEYYHIELDEHDVLFAEGAPAESYHEDNNRELFQDAQGMSDATAGKPAFAAILNGGDTVEAVWAQLYQRAGGDFAVATSDDPDLHLRVGGQRIDPESVEGLVYTFALPGVPTVPLHLCSRSGVPSLLGIGRADHRRLGVAVSRIVLRQPGIVTEFEHDAPLFLQGGAHSAEEGYSWTDGVLDLPATLFEHLRGRFTLSVYTQRPGMRYPLAALAEKAA